MVVADRSAAGAASAAGAVWETVASAWMVLVMTRHCDLGHTARIRVDHGDSAWYPRIHGGTVGGHQRKASSSEGSLQLKPLLPVRRRCER